MYFIKTFHSFIVDSRPRVSLFTDRRLEKKLIGTRAPTEIVQLVLPSSKRQFGMVPDLPSETEQLDGNHYTRSRTRRAAHRRRFDHVSSRRFYPADAYSPVVERLCQRSEHCIFVPGDFVDATRF